MQNIKPGPFLAPDVCISSAITLLQQANSIINIKVKVPTYNLKYAINKCKRKSVNFVKDLNHPMSDVKNKPIALASI
jgi:hypothetical protein